MTERIVMIPVDSKGNKIFIKDFREDVNGKNVFVKYKSSLNDIPFVETQLMILENGQTLAITGDDGTIIYRFATSWIESLINKEK